MEALVAPSPTQTYVRGRDRGVSGKIPTHRRRGCLAVHHDDTDDAHSLGRWSVNTMSIRSLTEDRTRGRLGYLHVLSGGYCQNQPPLGRCLEGGTLLLRIAAARRKDRNYCHQAYHFRKIGEEYIFAAT